MHESHLKLARMLRTTPEVISELDQKMSGISGQTGVIDSIIEQNHAVVDRTLSELGLTRDDTADTVYKALANRLVEFDTELFELLDKPDLSRMSATCGKLCEVAMKVFTPPKGLFIKKEKVVELLEKYRPQSLLDHFGYSTIAELVEKEGYASVVAALRFTQTQEWMHTFFKEAYKGLSPDDFEERDVELMVLDQKWLDIAEKFLKKKYHNISHLKEYGVIFVIPLKIDTPGETLRMFTLILHYLHEVPFYAGLIRRYMEQPDFTTKLGSLLRGDVPEGQAPESPHVTWRIVQRYLAKDDENDFRLKEAHVNPEAEHWLRAEQDLGRLSRMLPETRELDLGYWTGLDFVGDFFKDEKGDEILISFDLIDLLMSLVQKGEIKYLYHQQEALWNKLFIEYLGKERLDASIDEHIIDGFIKL
jgi:hypothetical protein